VSERWYKEAVVYCVDVASFQDSDGDGCGDLPGLTSRLDYLSRLGVTCLWLNPIYPSPLRDNGYDITDYYGIHPRLGTLGDFAELAAEARERGIRLVLDLVANHTSDEHPWFVSARRDPASPYRDWYVWSSEEPPDRRQGIVFPGEQTETWTYDRLAEQWYFHRFFEFQPDLNWQNRQVRAEFKKVMAFWLRLGASGFRIDAAPFVLEEVRPGAPPGAPEYQILDDWRQDVQWHQGDSVLLCEANVPHDDLARFCAAAPDGPNDRAHMLFAFWLNASLWLALARKSAEPLVEALSSIPRLPAMAQWATFLRNHDELDLSRLTQEQRSDVMAAFGPKPTMQLFGRGIRRRVAPMLGGDRRRIQLAYSLAFTMPGTPVMRYGDEIGMGEDLSLPAREAIRTPMQWDDTTNAGFSTAARDRLVLPVVNRGQFRYTQVNVRGQRRDGDSLINWFQALIGALRECPEIGVGTPATVDIPAPASVLAHRFDAPEGSILLLHNLADRPVRVDLSSVAGIRSAYQMFGDDRYATLRESGPVSPLNGYGYRWLRLRRSNADIPL